MNDATLAQGNGILTLILQKRTSDKKLQDIAKSGILADLLDSNIAEVDRLVVRDALNLKAFTTWITQITASPFEGIKLSLAVVPSAREIAIVMEIDGVQYVMLMVDKNHLVPETITTLRELRQVEGITGMAFSQEESVKQDKLVMCTDSNMTGIYVKMSDFPRVSDRFNQ